MKELILSTLTGVICGFVFAKLNLPIPAPGVLAGIMGILGIFLGYKIAGMF